MSVCGNKDLSFSQKEDSDIEMLLEIGRDLNLCNLFGLQTSVKIMD